MLAGMRSVHSMHHFLCAGLLVGSAFGCSDDSGGDDPGTNNTGGGTMNTATMNTATVNTATATTAPTTSTTASTNTATSTTGGGGGDIDLPADSSAAAITAFLEAEGYKGEGWTSVTEAPVPPTIGTPHGNVRVYLSQAVLDFREANQDEDNVLAVAPAVPGAMAVKEMFDEGTTIVGKAVIFYPANDVFYYCYGPEERCASGHPATTIDAPEWGNEDEAVVNQCKSCHSGNVYTAYPPE